MHQKVKDILGIVGIIALLAVSYGVFVFADTYSATSGMVPGFTVLGEGKITAVPDVATFDFSVITQGGTNLAELQNENIKKMNSAIDYIKSLGIEDEDIKTAQANISPRYTSVNCSRINGDCGPAEITGYIITQTVSVKVRDFDDLRQSFSGVVENGANSVTSLQFTVDDPTDLENQARAMAIEQAQEKAKAVANAGGFKLGRLLSVDENSYYPFGRYGFGASEAAMSFDAAVKVVPQIEPGSEDIVVQVMLRYEIK